LLLICYGRNGKNSPACAKVHSTFLRRPLAVERRFLQVNGKNLQVIGSFGDRVYVYTRLTPAFLQLLFGIWINWCILFIKVLIYFYCVLFSSTDKSCSDSTARPRAVFSSSRVCYFFLTRYDCKLSLN